MKIIKVAIFTVLTVLFFACSNKDQFQIEGVLSNSDGQTLFLEQLSLDGTVKVDSVNLKSKGNFRFSLPRLEYPSFFLLKIDDNNFITLLGDTTEKIVVEADAAQLSNNYLVKNSMGSSYVKTLNRKLDITTEKMDSLTNLFNAMADEDKEGKQHLLEDMENVIEKQKEFVFDFVMTNPRSFASYYAIFQRLNENTLVLNPYEKRDQNIFSAVATSLELVYPESPRVKQLTNFVLTIKKEQRLAEVQAKLLSQTPNTIPEIKEKDIHGKEHALTELKGKMVLLSFWASWHPESRKENERLKKIYQKYKSKGFVVYQVSLDRSKLLWEEAIEKDGLPWINVSDLQYTSSFPARTYNVQQLPANYLISPNQEIIGKDLFGRILDEKLQDLLK